MLSYAVGSGISDIGLIYPNSPFESQKNELPVYEIEDEFTNDTIIRIHPFKVDIVHAKALELDISYKLETIFEDTSRKLIIQLNNAINQIKLV